MIELAELSPYLLLGWVGSLHCIGMCGGFSIALCGGVKRRPRAFLQRQAAYSLGKATTYGVLGLLLASVGDLTAAEIAPLRRVLPWIAGGLMILMGLTWLGVRWPLSAGVPRLREQLGRPARAARGALQLMGALPPTLSALGVGIVNGLLPCGLSWGVLLLASQASPAVAFLGPWLFGLATSPALALVGAGSWFASARLMRWARPLVGGALILCGAWVCLRGLPAHTNSCAGCEATLRRGLSEPSSVQHPPYNAEEVDP